MSDSLIEAVRPTFKTKEAVSKWLQEQANLLLQQVVEHQQTAKVAQAKGQKYDMSVFDCFSGEFGGDRDAHEIADELHASRKFTHEISAL